MVARGVRDIRLEIRKTRDGHREVLYEGFHRPAATPYILLRENLVRREHYI